MDEEMKSTEPIEEKPVWKETPRLEPGAWNPTPEQRQSWEEYKRSLWEDSPEPKSGTKTSSES